MLDKILEKNGYLEVFARRFLFKHPEIKKKMKYKMKHNVQEKMPFEQEKWNKYKKSVHEIIKDEEVLLIHSSIDGFNSIGVSVKEVMELIQELIQRKCTVVIPAYPITNLKIVNKSMKPYDPIKTLCWTGMLPNQFMKMQGVIRSTIPYNSLAAIGPDAKKMMEKDTMEQYVYGENSPWNYCVKHHAKILFIGTTPNDSNTIQTHMIADYMKEEWPIDNWYEKIVAPVKENGNVIQREIFIQNNYWTQFVADRYINAILKKKGIVEEREIEGCSFGVVKDSAVMVEELVSLCKKGKLNYLVPKKYLKKKEYGYE